jgi:hypothetical protein
MIKASNKVTGEVIELETDNIEQTVTAWEVAQGYEKLAKDLKDQLKKIVPGYVGDKGVSDEANKAIFRISHIQRMTYDKAVVRRVLDEDVFDLVTKIDKSKLDTYIKENLAELGDASTEMRSAMIPDGSAYEVIKLERF